MKTQFLYNLEQLPEVIQNLSQELRKFNIITLTGDLGAGKTTFTKKLLAQWGVQDAILSPTFTYVNCYKNDQGVKLFHFDLYRVTSLDQFLELGFDEYLSEPEVICLIEWPQVIKDLLDNKPRGAVCRLEIEHVSDEKRKLVINE